MSVTLRREGERPETIRYWVLRVTADTTLKHSEKRFARLCMRARERPSWIVPVQSAPRVRWYCRYCTQATATGCCGHSLRSAAYSSTVSHPLRPLRETSYVYHPVHRLEYFSPIGHAAT